MLLPALASAAVLLGGASLLLAHDPVFDLRLQTESDADWYGAVYSAPATLDLQADRTSTVDLDVRNAGRMTWTSSGNHPFALGYRWLTGDGDGVLDVPPAEVPLTHDVEPGETIHLRASLAVPDVPPGTYRLDWGMLQRDVLQFYERGWADAETQVSIGRERDVRRRCPDIYPRDDDRGAVGRRAAGACGAPAARLIAAHPILGVGPDNFRHYLWRGAGTGGVGRTGSGQQHLSRNPGRPGRAGPGGLCVADRRTAGGCGVGNFQSSAAHAYVALGVGLAIVAFLVHGMLDSFLAFNPTAWLLWLLLGIASASRWRVRGSRIEALRSRRSLGADRPAAAAAGAARAGSGRSPGGSARRSRRAGACVGRRAGSGW